MKIIKLPPVDDFGSGSEGDHAIQESMVDEIEKEMQGEDRSTLVDEPEGLAAIFKDTNDLANSDAPGSQYPTMFISENVVPCEVAKKIIAASAKLTNIPASGVDQSIHSRYSTHDDIMKACNPVLEEVGLGIIFMGYEVISTRVTGKNARGTPETEVQIRSYFDVIDTDSGESYRIAAPGVGKSYGGKAIFIATTMATNYAYRLVLKFGAESKASSGAPLSPPRRDAGGPPRLPTAAKIGGE